MNGRVEGEPDLRVEPAATGAESTFRRAMPIGGLERSDMMDELRASPTCAASPRFQEQRDLE